MRVASPTRRDGNVTVVTACCLVVVMAFVAFAVDGGLLLDQRRRVQSAADAAALAAADDLYAHYQTNQGVDPSGTARQAALDAAAANGYAAGPGCSVDVYIPPVTGPNAGKAGHAEVRIAYNQPRFFSQVMGSDVLPVGGRAVGRGRRSSIADAILVLDPTATKGALNSGGGGTVTVTGAPVQVNSTDPSAMIANGNGTMSAPEFDVTGSPGWSTPGGGSFSGAVMPSSQQIADPLAYLPAPNPASLPVQSSKKLSLAGGNSVTLQPGVYVGGIQITGKGSVTLSPGIYYMQGGGFSWNGQGALTAAGVMVYNAPQSNSDTVSLSGSGTCVMSPPTSGPYQGLTVFQDRTATTPLSVTGNGGMSVTGTFYAASALLSVTGNGTNNVIGAQYISYDLALGGNGAMNINWTMQSTPGTREIKLVE